jgi:hypothetical protein
MVAKRFQESSTTSRTAQFGISKKGKKKFRSLISCRRRVFGSAGLYAAGPTVD